MIGRLALGTVQFGLAYGAVGNDAPVAEPEARAILRAAADAGVERLDTAAAYGDIETRLARLIGDLSFGVVSKIPALPAELSVDDARSFATQAVRRSHDRLGGLLVGILFHSADGLADTAGQAAWQAASDAAEAIGVALGVSAYGPDAVAALAPGQLPQMVQLPGSALDQRVVDLAESAPLEVTLRSVFLQGLLLMPEDAAVRRVPAAAGALRRWREWCREHDLSPLVAAFSVAKAVPNVDYQVVGVDSVAQFIDVAAAWGEARPIVAPELSSENPDVFDPRRWPVPRMRAA